MPDQRRLLIVFFVTSVLLSTTADDSSIPPTSPKNTHSELCLAVELWSYFGGGVVTGVFLFCFGCFFYLVFVLDVDGENGGNANRVNVAAEDPGNPVNVVAEDPGNPPNVVAEQHNIEPQPAIVVVENPIHKFSFNTLVTATNNFSNDNLVYQFGTVSMHRGTLVADGRLVAVKSVPLDLVPKSVKEKVHHRNVAEYVGYCVHQGVRMLVYEHGAQATTLREHLSGLLEQPPLTWATQMLNLAFEVARGLYFLHDLAGTPFLHGDLNFSNILVDSDDTIGAKITGYSLIEVAQQGAEKTEDIYAYGVVLIGLLTGLQPPAENMAAEVADLVRGFRKCHYLYKRGQVKQLMSIIPHFGAVDQETKQHIGTISDIAYYCTSPSPDERPGLQTIIMWLHPIMQPWNPPILEEEEMNEAPVDEWLQRWAKGDFSSSSGQT